MFHAVAEDPVRAAEHGLERADELAVVVAEEVVGEQVVRGPGSSRTSRIVCG